MGCGVVLLCDRFVCFVLFVVVLVCVFRFVFVLLCLVLLCLVLNCCVCGDLFSCVMLSAFPCCVVYCVIGLCFGLLLWCDVFVAWFVLCCFVWWYGLCMLLLVLYCVVVVLLLYCSCCH